MNASNASPAFMLVTTWQIPVFINQGDCNAQRINLFTKTGKVGLFLTHYFIYIFHKIC